MARPRNTQYSKFWRAQSVLCDISKPLKTERGVARIVQVARDREFLRRRYPELGSRHIRVSFTDAWAASADRYSISVPKSEWSTHCIARLIAHLIWHRKQPYGFEGYAFHGPEFCGIFVDVVHAMMGKAAAELLKNAFAVHGVRFKPKKKVVVTDEMRARLAAARAKREQCNAEEA